MVSNFWMQCPAQVARHIFQMNQRRPVCLALSHYLDPTTYHYIINSSKARAILIDLCIFSNNLFNDTHTHIHMHTHALSLSLSTSKIHFVKWVKIMDSSIIYLTCIQNTLWYITQNIENTSSKLSYLNLIYLWCILNGSKYSDEFIET